MAPVLANKIPGLNQWDTPLDLGMTYKGTRLLGPNKRVRGVVFGTLLAAVASLVIITVSDLPYAVNTFLIGGTFMGLGALLGDAIESFFKRRVGVKPGLSWFPFDQTDYIIGGLLFSYPILTPSMELVFQVFVLYFGLHIVVSYIGYLLGFKNKPI